MDVGSAANVDINTKQNSVMSSELNASTIPSLVPNEVTHVLPNEPIASTNSMGSCSNDNNKESCLYAKLFKGDTSRKGANFRPLPGPASNKVDVAVSRDSVHVVHERFSNTVYGFFLGKHVVYPVVENYVKKILGVSLV